MRSALFLTKEKKVIDSLIFAVNAVTPIIALAVIGFALKKAGFVDEKFAKQANKLVFRVFLPVMLFLNVYKVENLAEFDYGYIAYALVAVVLIFLVAFPLSMLVTKRADRRGVLVQAAFRSNYALIGIPLAGSLFGEAGEIVASLLAVVGVPLFNVLAVIALTVFNSEGKRPTVGGVLLGIVKNPLIQGVFAGIVALAVRVLLINFNIDFRISDIEPLWKTLSYLSGLATPVALIALGAQFEFSALPGMKRELIYGVTARTLVVPTLALGIAYLLFGDRFTGAHFAALVAVFATPNAVSTVPMTQEMGGDAYLAGQLVVWTTLLSTFTIFAAAFVLRLLGIF